MNDFGNYMNRFFVLVLKKYTYKNKTFNFSFLNF